MSYVKYNGEEFATIYNAVEYISNNEDIDSANIEIYSSSGELIELQEVERNSHSGDFIYTAYGLTIKNAYDEDEYEGIEYNTLEDAKKAALGKNAKIFLVEQSLYESIECTEVEE